MAQAPFDLDDLRDAIRSRRYLLKYHARQRRKERGFSQQDIEGIILNGDVVESSPHAIPYPKCLMMLPIDDEPTYVSVAYHAESHYAYIITVHGYDPAKWIDPWTRRSES